MFSAASLIDDLAGNLLPGGPDPYLERILIQVEALEQELNHPRLLGKDRREVAPSCPG